MDRLHAIGLFVAVADARSFAAAARAKGLSAPAVTRAIASLEDHLGARLITRTTRTLSLTEAGEAFAAHARRILAELEEAERAAAGATAEPRGHLTVSATVTLGRLHLAPVLTEFLAAEPRVTASLSLNDRVVNLVEEGVDLAMRVGTLEDSGLIARRIGMIKRLLVASPAYVARHGMPQSAEDLRQHQVIGFAPLPDQRDVPLTDPESGRVVPVPIRARLEVNDPYVALQAARDGAGIAAALCTMAMPLMQAGALVQVLPDWAPQAKPVHLVWPSGRLAAAKLRAFIDFAIPRLQARMSDQSAHLRPASPLPADLAAE